MTPGRNRLDQIVRGLDGVTAYAPKGHLQRFLVGKGKYGGCWVYGHPTGPDDELLYSTEYVRDLEERLAKAAEALEPFAEIAPLVETTDRRDGERVHEQRRADGSYHVLTRDDFRRARTALTTIRRTEK